VLNVDGIRLVVVVGRLLPGNRRDSRAWAESGAKAAVGKTMTADGGYQGTVLPVPHRRRCKGEELPDRKESHNRSHKQVRARVERTFARMKEWKIRSGSKCYKFSYIVPMPLTAPNRVSHCGDRSPVPTAHEQSGSHPAQHWSTTRSLRSRADLGAPSSEARVSSRM